MAKDRLPLVFVDASVLIAGVLSSEGASKVILSLGKEKLIELILTEEVVKEARLGIKKKYLNNKAKLESLYVILSDLKYSIQPTPKPGAIKKFDKLIVDPNDRHVLAAAKQYKASSLVTLDRKHFFTPTLQEAHLNFEIKLPGEFLKTYRSTLTA